MKPDNQGYAVGQRVRGSIEKLLPYGLFVRLPDGTRAYIRRRELTWAGNVDPQDRWRPGEEIEAVVLKLAEADHSLELSHKRTLADPWNQFVARYQAGDVVEGTVKSLTSYGVFVEVAPGVDGLLPLSELTTAPDEQPEDILWVDDDIEAVITHLDPQNKKLKLSIRIRIEQLKVVADIMQQIRPAPEIKAAPSSAPGSTPAPAEEMAAETGPAEVERVGPILVVDDHDEIRLPLVNWLRRRGYRVAEAKNAGEAFQQISEGAYGLLIVDLNMPDEDGLALLQRVRQAGLSCRAVVMTAPEWLAERSRDIEQLGVIEAFAKPFDLDEINHLLIRIGRNETVSRWQFTTHDAGGQVPAAFYQLESALQSSMSLAGQLRAGLQALVNTTPAEAGLIFELDPVSHQVSIVAEAGQATLDTEAVHTLRESPVRDVIEEERIILEPHVQSQSRERFRKLLDLLTFDSCIGVPLEASGETHHALFLFHRKADVFHRYHLRDALAAGYLFSTAIERQALEQRLMLQNNLLLSGHLARGFSHEVYNKMSGLEIQLRNLQAEYRASGYHPDDRPEAGDLQQSIDTLVSTFGDLKATVSMFQQLMRADETGQVGINQVVEKSASILRPVLRQQGVKLVLELGEQLPAAVGSPVRLQQAFLNIMLNAGQQMATKASKPKRMKITTRYDNGTETQPVKVCFQDSGPGIHRQLWEKIFDLGFTTRPEGTGQGLYIARSLIESFGGSIRVEQSTILLGATFLVALPAARSGKD